MNQILMKHLKLIIQVYKKLQKNNNKNKLKRFNNIKNKFKTRMMILMMKNKKKNLTLKNHKKNKFKLQILRQFNKMNVCNHVVEMENAYNNVNVNAIRKKQYNQKIYQNQNQNQNNLILYMMMYAFVVTESIKVIVLQIVVRWLNVEIINIVK